MKKKKKEEVEELRKQVEEYKQKYLRALADYRNLLNRLEEEKKAAVFETLSSILRDFLEVFDDIEKAEGFVKDEGLRMIKEKFRKVFLKWNVQELKLEGERFNPELAEVIDTIEGEREGIVKKVYQKGYKLGDKVLRHAKVQVSKVKS